MNRYFALLGLLLLVYSSGCCTTRCHTQTCCSSCGKTCSPEIKETESTHNCYADKCKDVCIPAVRFPWEDCCDPLRCGKVRSVKVLTKWEYKCPDCEVKWNVVNSGCSANGCTGACGGRCAGGVPFCGDSTGPATVLESPAETPTEAPRPMPVEVKPMEDSPSELPPMPPMVIEQTSYFVPAF
ncbi:hypothetical protein [Blastopirellula marina]|uniref:4Fe-4S ferredoxin-type domain-containing protein n=1 Tax=Blastopirellula marina TaxID=124 RepID=A0A2S8GD34_9BACT|nr:hypothetical protein [Blastopirellula marina]PQO42376.1 hypothetical protein C5Y93_29015 [Blastopirellula marina]